MFKSEPIYIWHHGLNVCWEGYLIWMLFSMTLGNFLLCKSQVKESLYQKALSSMFEVEPLLCVFVKKKKKHYPKCFG